MSLINTFKKQSRETIQDILTALTADNKVFSARLITTQAPFLDEHEYFAYMQGDEVVFLVRDKHRMFIDVLADENFFYDEPPLYFANGLHWTSPVYLVQLMCHAYKEVMRKTGWEAGKVHCVFVTNTNLINREDLEEIWKWQGVTVIDRAKMHGEIETDIHDLVEERKRMDHFLDNSYLSTWKLDPKYDRIGDDFPYSTSLLEDDEDDEKERSNVADEEENKDEEPENELSEDTDEPKFQDLEEMFTYLLDQFIMKEEKEVPKLDTEKDDKGDMEEGKEETGTGNDLPHPSIPESLEDQFSFTPFEESSPMDSESEDEDENEDENENTSHDSEETEEMERHISKDINIRVESPEDIVRKRKKDDTMRLEYDEEPPEVDLPDLGPLKGVEIIQPLRHPWERLNRLVGLEEIKKRILSLSMLAKYNSMLRENGARPHKISLHSIFYGNPGTGKTIVGRMYASILWEAGILSKGHVVLANGRQAFVGSLFGEEETNVDKLLKLAQGGVLMIDEAYTLLTSHKDDPGKNVLPLLMKAMADEENRDFAVILTGYQEPIERLLELNPGLDSRFPEINRFLFQDFSLEELCKIAKAKLGEYGYTLTSKAWAKLKDIIAHEYANRDREKFGNGRFVANLLEEIYQRHAVRCVSCHMTELAELQRFTANDIQQEKTNKGKGMRRTIGFTK